MTEQRVREIIREELAAGCPPWADDKPAIDRSLRGWVLVTDEDGDQFVRWASADGMAKYKDEMATQSWEGLDDRGWSVEPFPTGYTISDIDAVLNEIFDEEWARNKDDEMLWPGIGHVVTRLRRLKEEA